MRAGIERHTLNRIKGGHASGPSRRTHPHCGRHRGTARASGPRVAPADGGIAGRGGSEGQPSSGSGTTNPRTG
ncbi:hypothetical protein ABT224_02725 [Streptomyces sp. NPDC001584]|uniref:hypothetical protein n=1 Tax=Streptomyces sp. NPDC001584 TaxID=3154521 RepID=UPI0033320D66